VASRAAPWIGPPLAKLLDDVRARKIDVIVVYKVDRLTRSLADFAKLVELFDEYDVSFVSVTQAFNTTTSMGRFTLNMLLSFAQFEREITGERTKSLLRKREASGWAARSRSDIGSKTALFISLKSTNFVRTLFGRYLELGSVLLLKAPLSTPKTFDCRFEFLGRAERRVMAFCLVATSTASSRTPSMSDNFVTRAGSPKASTRNN
jgi:DNA invertase Pin-like site-specific DNA recombinase